MESPSTNSVAVCLTQGIHPVESVKSESINTINLIPPEILSKIFLACALCWTNDTTYDDIYGYSLPPSPLTRDDSEIQGEFISASHLPWIKITRVCRYWRSVALACAQLWRGLIFSRGTATKQMISLSKGAALIVKAGSSNWSRETPMYRNVGMAITELQRISVLHLQFPANLLQLLVDGLVAAAPALQSLRLSALEDDFVSRPQFTLPETLFNQCTPSLRLLELTHCQHLWRSPSLRGLTHLELHKPSVPHGIPQILSFLQEAPILDTLILDRALSADSQHAGTIPLRLFLPNLYRLTLDDSVNNCADLLECLTYSAKTLLSFKCEISSNDSLDRVFHAIQSAAAYGEGDYVIHALGLSLKRDYYSKGNGLTLRCWVIVRHSTPMPHRGQPVQLTFALRGPLWNFPAQALRAAGIAICLTDVQTLYVGPAQHEVDWLSFLRLLPNVHTIHIERQLPTHLVEVLADNGKEEETKMNASTTPLLPRLRNLWLTGVKLDSGRHQETLLMLFRSRLRFGVAIERISLRHCWGFFKADVMKLKEFVQDVDWDEFEGYNVAGFSDSAIDSDSD